MKGPIFTVSNFMSFLRVVFAWPIAALLYKGTPEANYWAIALCGAACVTDILDGYFARKFNQISDLGKLVDPVADKLLVGVVALLLMQLRGFPWWLFGAIICRDLVIMSASLFLIKKTKKIHMSNYWGKFTVVLISLTMLMYMLQWENAYPWTIGASLFMLFASSVSYFLVFWRALGTQKEKIKDFEPNIQEERS